MSTEVQVKLRNDRAYAEALRRISPAENPEILRRAFREELGPRLVQGIQGFMRGPRPQHVDRVTGALHDSVTFTATEKKLEVGVPNAGFRWWELHEFGSAGGRRQRRRSTLTRGYPARPAVQPGLAEAVESGDLARGLLRVWEDALGE